jgi:peptide/nickel transport system ATP-binding protein
MMWEGEHPFLLVEDLSVQFHTDRGVVRALEKVHLSVGEGEVVGLIGESGSGKTTTVRSVLRILPPSARITEGLVRFMGRDLLTMSEKDLNMQVRGRAITLVPQDPFNSLNPVFTVGTQIHDILRWKGGGSHKETKQILDVLREVQIPSPLRQLRKYPHQFSGGQRQRLMISMALLPHPGLVIADEPTTALDVTVEAQILRLFRGLVEERGVSVLFITHDLGVASQICTRIVVMYAGQDMEDAPAEKIFTLPGHPYTRELLESLPRPDGNIRDIPGEVPSLLHPPSGCRFHPRCPVAESRCTQESPPKVEIRAGHWVRCFRPLE